MITQFTTPIPVQTPKGKTWAIAMIDYGPQWDLQWVTFIHATGECWTFRNQEIRQGQNYTWGLPEPTEIKHNIAKHEETNGHAHLNGETSPVMRSAINGFPH